MNLMADGLVLLLLGQTVVFLFLGLMVVFIRLTATVLARLTPPSQPQKGPPPTAPSPRPTEDLAEITAAISAALHRHRSPFSNPSTPSTPGA